MSMERFDVSGLGPAELVDFLKSYADAVVECMGSSTFVTVQ